jgi:hypothetical protein
VKTEAREQSGSIRRPATILSGIKNWLKRAFSEIDFPIPFKSFGGPFGGVLP